MQLSPNLLILPICTFGTLGWAVCSSSTSASTSSFRNSLHTLAAVDAQSDSAMLRDELSALLKSAIDRCEMQIARDTLQFLAAFEVQRQREHTLAAGDERNVFLGNLLSCNGLMCAAVEALQQQQQQHHYCHHKIVFAQSPLVPAKFDLSASRCSDRLGAIGRSKEGEQWRLCNTVFLAELALSSTEGGAAKAEAMLSSAQMEDAVSGEESLLQKWEDILLLLARFLQGTESAEHWSSAMMKIVTAGAAGYAETTSLGAQLRLRAAFILFDSDFFAEHLFLASTPLGLKIAKKKKKPSIAAATVPAPGETTAGEAADALSVRLQLRVARAKLISFISSTESPAQQVHGGSVSTPDLHAGVDFLLATLNDAQRRVAPPTLDVAFSVVMIEALESICHLSLCCLLKLLFLAQSQSQAGGAVRIVCAVTSSGEEEEQQQQPERKKSLLGFIKSFVGWFSVEASAAAVTPSVTVSTLAAVSEHLQSRIEEVQSLWRCTAATKQFDCCRLRKMKEMTTSLLRIFDAASASSAESSRTKNEPELPPNQRSLLLSLLHLTSSEAHSVSFAARIKLRCKFLSHIQIVPVGDGENVRIVLKPQAAPDDELEKKHRTETATTALNCDAFLHEQHLFAALLGEHTSSLKDKN